MGACGWAVASDLRTRSALNIAGLFRSASYFVHRNSGTVWAAIDSATVFGTHGSAEADRCRLPAFGGGPSADRGETIDGGAAFGPLAMIVLGAGKNRMGGGGDVGGGGSSDDESSLRRARPRLFARTRRDCDRLFGCGDRDRGGAYAAAAGGNGGMIAGGVVPGLGVDAVDAVEGCCCIARVDKDAFAAAG